MNLKKILPQTGIEPMLLAFKASVLACFPGKHDNPTPFAFKASETSAAPLVLHYTGTASLT